MQWSEFLDTADRLASGATEGDWRSAASRAYYAVFHYFYSLFLAHGLDIGKGGQAHWNLHAGLNNCGFPGVSPIAGMINDLRILRIDADYSLSSVFRQPDARDSVRSARAIIADFQSALVTTP